MVHHPHRDFGDPGRKLLIFNAVKLVDRDAGQQGCVDLLVAILGLERFQFQGADFAIGDDQKIAAPAGGIEKGQPRQLVLKFAQRPVPACLARDDGGQFRFQIIQKQRPDDLHDIGFGGVMRALRPPFLRVHHRLEQRPENGGRYARPVVPRRVQQMIAHRLGEMRGADTLGEQAAIHIGKGVEFRLQCRLAGIFRRVQHVEQVIENTANITAVGPRVVFDKLEENILGLENAGVVGKQAEEQPDQQLFQIMPDIARFLQRVVQLAHQFRRLDGDACLGFKADLAAQHEIESGDMLVQIGEAELQLCAGFKVQKHPGLEIAGQHPAGLLRRVDALHIIERLALRPAKVQAGAFLFDQQRAGPEQVDKAMAIVQQLDALFIDRDLLALDAENLEKFIVECLGLAALIVRVFPFIAERLGPPLDLIPA